MYAMRVLCVGAFCAVHAFAANSSDIMRVGFQPLADFVGSGVGAMGQGGAAMGGPGWILRNPALGDRFEGPALSCQYGMWLRDADQRSGLFELVLPSGQGTYGLTAGTYSIDGLHRVSWAGELPDMNSSSSQRVSTAQLAASYAFFEDVHAGLVLGMAEDRIMDSRAWAVFGGAGLLMTPTAHIAAGLSLVNAGITTAMADTNENFGDGENLPFTVRLGGTWTDTIRTFLPFSISLDLRYDYQGDTASEIGNNFTKRLTVPLGISLTPLPYLSIRAGKRIGWEGELFDFGLGLHVSPFSVDLACSLPRFADETEFRFSTALSYEPQKPSVFKRRPRAERSGSAGTVDPETVSLFPISDTPAAAPSPAVTDTAKIAGPTQAAVAAADTVKPAPETPAPAMSPVPAAGDTLKTLPDSSSAPSVLPPADTVQIPVSAPKDSPPPPPAPKKEVPAPLIEEETVILP